MNYSTYKILVPLSHHPNAVADDQIHLTGNDLFYIHRTFPEIIHIAEPYLIVEYVIDTVIIGNVCAATKEINQDVKENKDAN